MKTDRDVGAAGMAASAAQMEMRKPAATANERIIPDAPEKRGLIGGVIGGEAD